MRKGTKRPSPLMNKFRPPISLGRAEIDLPDDELAAVTAAIRDVIEDDPGSLMPRASIRCVPRWERSRRRRPQSQARSRRPSPPPAKADKRARR